MRRSTLILMAAIVFAPAVVSGAGRSSVPHGPGETPQVMPTPPNCPHDKYQRLFRACADRHPWACVPCPPGYSGPANSAGKDKCGARLQACINGS